MAKRDKREVRMSTLHTFYQTYKAGIFDPTDADNNLAIAKSNVQYSGQLLFTSELDKFAEKFPAVDIEDFKSFLDSTGGIKKSGKKGTGEGGGMPTRLNTPEAAVERGVTEANIPAYLAGVNAIYEQSHAINSLMTNARVSFAIPKKIPKS